MPFSIWVGLDHIHARAQGRGKGLGYPSLLSLQATPKVSSCPPVIHGLWPQTALHVASNGTILHRIKKIPMETTATCNPVSFTHRVSIFVDGFEIEKIFQWSCRTHRV